MYHLVWFPKRCDTIFQNAEIRHREEQPFREISDEYELEIQEIEAGVDYVHILISFHLKYSIGQMVRMLKSIRARGLLREYPRIKKRLRSGLS